MALGDILDVQHATHNATTNTLALPAFAVDPSNGDTIVVMYSVWTTTGIQQAPTDSASNTYVQVGTEVSNSKPEIVGMWYAHNVTGGSSFVVTGHLASNQHHTACAWLLSGDLIYNSDFKSNGGATNVSPFSTGVSSPAPSGVAIFLGALCIDTSLPTATDGSGWNDTSSHGFTAAMQGRARYTPFTTVDLYTQYKFATATGLAAEWSITGGANHNYNCLVASFGSSSPPIALTPSPSIATWTLPSATVTGGAATITVAAPTISTWTNPLASITGSNLTFSPGSAIASWTNPAVTLTTGEATISASSAVMTWTNPAATLTTGNIALSLGTASTHWTVPTATISGGSPIVVNNGPYTTNRLFTAPSAASGVSITPNAGAWADSTWVTLVASTDAAWILTGLVVKPDSVNQTEMFEIDIGVGPAASEVVVTTFRGTYSSASSDSPGILPAPIPLDNIGSGVRVSTRLRKSNLTTGAWRVACQFYKKPLIGNLLVSAQPQQAYPAASDDIELTDGASVWASSTYTEIVASTSAAIVVVGLVVDILSLNAGWEVDIAVGAGASEVVVQTIRAYHTGIQFTDGPNLIMFRRPLDNIAAGSRISCRTRCQIITGTRRLYVALVYLEKPL